MSYKQHRERQLVFVYGTLMSGLPNNYLLGTSEFIGKAITKNKMLLTADCIPFLNDLIEDSNIEGEVYSVTEDVLATLDKLEGYRGRNYINFYERSAIDVILKDKKKTELDCWVYIQNDHDECENISNIGYRKYYENYKNGN